MKCLCEEKAPMPADSQHNAALSRIAFIVMGKKQTHF